MSCEHHQEYLENKLDMWRDEIYTEYEKYFSPEEIEILKRIIYKEVDLEIYKEKLIDFFNEIFHLFDLFIKFIGLISGNIESLDKIYFPNDEVLAVIYESLILELI